MSCVSLKELKTVLLSCSGELLDSSVHLKEVVEQQGLQLLQSGGEDKSVKRRKSVLKSARHLSVFLEVSFTALVNLKHNTMAFLQVMSVIPTAFTYPELLRRCCLVLTISHIGLVHSLVSYYFLKMECSFSESEEHHLPIVSFVCVFSNPQEKSL